MSKFENVKSKFENVNYFNDIKQRNIKRDWMRSVTRQENISPVAKNLKFWAVKDRKRYYKEFKIFVDDLASGVYGDVEDASILGYLAGINYEFFGDEVFDDFIGVLPEVDTTRPIPTTKGRGSKGGKTVFGVNRKGIREPAKVMTFKRYGRTVTVLYGLESKKFIKSSDSLKELKGKRGF